MLKEFGSSQSAFLESLSTPPADLFLKELFSFTQAPISHGVRNRGVFKNQDDYSTG
jgi:hypothetical protein